MRRTTLRALLSRHARRDDSAALTPAPPPSSYAEFRPGGRATEGPSATNWTELYDIAADPFQLVNLALEPSESALVAQLSRELWAIGNCSLAECP